MTMFEELLGDDEEEEPEEEEVTAPDPKLVEAEQLLKETLAELKKARTDGEVSKAQIVKLEEKAKKLEGKLELLQSELEKTRNVHVSSEHPAPVNPSSSEKS